MIVTYDWVGLILLNQIIFFIWAFMPTLFAATLSPEVQAVVDHYASPAVYNAFITKGESVAQQFTEPAFIDHFVHAEERRKEAYMNWYNTPCFGERPLAPSWKPSLQKGDIACVGIAAAGWGLEWLLYTSAHQFFVQAYCQHLQATEPDTLFYAYKQKKHWATLVALAAMSTVASSAFSYSTKKIYFDSWLDSEHQHRSLVHVLPRSVKQHLLQAINPQTWFDTCNEWFDYFGMLPEWSKTTLVHFSKGLICNIACLIWYERTILAPHWEEECKKIITHGGNIKTHFPTTEEQEAFVSQALALPFLPWLKNKYYVTACCNTCVSGVLALTSAYKAYKTLKPMIQEHPCSHAV